MTLVIIGLSPRVISRRSWGKWIRIPSRIADSYSVHRIGIHVPVSRLKHLLARIGAVTTRFELHFNPVKTCSYSKNHKCTAYKRSSTIANTISHHSNYNQRQRMTPNKPKYLYGGIQYTLSFVSNLHVVQQFSLIDYIIAQILLKIHEFRRTKHRFFKYIGQNNNTIRTV